MEVLRNGLRNNVLISPHFPHLSFFFLRGLTPSPVEFFAWRIQPGKGGDLRWVAIHKKFQSPISIPLPCGARNVFSLWIFLRKCVLFRTLWNWQDIFMMIETIKFFFQNYSMHCSHVHDRTIIQARIRLGAKNGGDVNTKWDHAPYDTI